jgi:hypothetical protein
MASVNEDGLNESIAAPYQSVEIWAKDDVVVGNGRKLYHDTPTDFCCTICVKSAEGGFDIHLSREQAQQLQVQLEHFLRRFGE